MTSVVPRAAATACVVRDGTGGLEVLLATRSPSAPFVPGAAVFPGGTVDAADRRSPDPYKAAAIRETFEEVGLLLADKVGSPLDHRRPIVEQRAIEDFDFDRLVYLSTWVTPEGLGYRFDTRFYLAVAPAQETLTIDQRELVSARWYRPVDALAEGSSGGLVLISPTVAHLRYLEHYGTVNEALTGAVESRHAADIDQVIQEGRRPRD